MSKDWVLDLRTMHDHYEFHEALDKMDKTDPELLQKFLKFRLAFMREEMAELVSAVELEDAEEVVDALIDICVVAIGTLDLFEVDAHGAWEEVLRANMSKRKGIKPGRPNPLGLPDLMKPEGWTSPNHAGNHGLLSTAFDVL